ncbi:unnamed protein product [Spirodela intermedia]|nr:unnamed protein product [Spirodela intermedia]CAA6672553.1 unnamed protein product [Spirodela intermedia]
MSFEESVYRYMHRNRSLDVDTMSYEELLELEEQIGKANAGLSEDTVQKNLKRMKYPSSAAYKAESCCICQEDYADGEELGVLTCGHDFHASCVGKWLVQKNFCPICKKTALST